MFALPGMSQEVFTWVDEEGVTHFALASTSAKHALRVSAKGTLEVRPVTVAMDTIAGATVLEPLDDTHQPKCGLLRRKAAREFGTISGCPK